MQECRDNCSEKKCHDVQHIIDCIIGSVEFTSPKIYDTDKNCRNDDRSKRRAPRDPEGRERSRNAILRNNLHSNIKSLLRALCYEGTRFCKRSRNRIFKEVWLAVQILVSQSPRWNTARYAVLLNILFESPKRPLVHMRVVHRCSLGCRNSGF